MKILLFGGRGQVGWELRRALSPLGDLVVVDRERADFENPAQLGAIVEAEAPDVVVNAAAYTAVDRAETDVDKARLVNAVAVATLARAVLAQAALMIHYSTDYVFDGLNTLSYREGDPCHPINAYGKTKCEGDQAILASGCNHLIFRTSWVHSARGNNFVRKILRLATEQSSLSVAADQFGAPTGAEWIADITALAIARRSSGLALPSGLYHLAASGRTSWHAFARFVVSEAQLRGCALKARPETILPVSGSEPEATAARPRNSVMDTSKLSTALSIAFPDWTHHARRTISEILENRADGA